MLNDKTRYLNKGMSPHLRKGWQKSLKSEKKKIIERATAIIEEMLQDADNGKLIVTNKGYQATATTTSEFVYFKESDEIEYIKEPEGKIIYPAFTGIQNHD